MQMVQACLFLVDVVVPLKVWAMGIVGVAVVPAFLIAVQVGFLSLVQVEGVFLSLAQVWVSLYL